MKIYTLKTSELCSTNGKNETALYPPFDKMKIPFYKVFLTLNLTCLNKNKKRSKEGRTRLYLILRYCVALHLGKENLN